jgi:hypothetical protein
MNAIQPNVTFSERENLNEFKTMYAITSTMLKWTEDDKVKNIRAFLSGDAGGVYDSWHSAGTTTDELKKNVNLVFDLLATKFCTTKEELTKRSIFIPSSHFIIHDHTFVPEIYQVSGIG